MSTTPTDAQIAKVSDLASKGVAKAQRALGLMYDLGNGVPQNYPEAVRWHQKAAEQGDADAQYYVGSAYITGDGADPDDSRAVKWFRLAAVQGHAEACRALGDAYADGKGVGQSNLHAVDWYTKGAEAGDAVCQQLIGSAYSERALNNHFGEPLNEKHGLFEALPDPHNSAAKDLEISIDWFTKVADSGIAGGSVSLGNAYLHGLGVPKDVERGLSLIRKAAEEGNEVAAEILARPLDP